MIINKKHYIKPRRKRRNVYLKKKTKCILHTLNSDQLEHVEHVFSPAVSLQYTYSGRYIPSAAMKVPKCIFEFDLYSMIQEEMQSMDGNNISCIYYCLCYHVYAYVTP